MLNPFGLIILIAVPAIKTTDAFVQLRGLQNVTKRFFFFFWEATECIFFKGWFMTHCPPPSHPFTPSPPLPITDYSRGQGHPTMQARLLWRCIQGCGARYHGERTAPFQRWVEKYFLVLLRAGCLLCLCSSGVSVSACVSVVHACLHVLHFREDQNKPDIFKQLASV